MAKQERHGAAHTIKATRTQDQSAHHQKTQGSCGCKDCQEKKS